MQLLGKKMAKTTKKNKKANNQIGIAIITLGLLLLFGALFFDVDYQTKSDYLNSKSSSYNSYPQETYLFYLNDTDIGRQSKVVESFPNIELGSKTTNNIIYRGNTFKIKSNPFSKTYYSFDLDIKKPLDTQEFLLYFNTKRITGNQNLIIKMNNEIFYDNDAKPNDIPINIKKKLSENQTKVKITFELQKPKWYQIFNWNTMEINSLQVVEVTQDSDNNQKEFDFELDKQYLESVQLTLITDCEDTKTNKPIKVTVNGYVLADYNPDCTSYLNTINKQIPLNILKTQNNKIEFETSGYYKLSYNLNKIYYNDKDTYKFTINSFNDIIDVVMYGDFDEEVIDLRLNSQTMSLKRDEIMSIIPYLRYGTNELKFLTKPLDIDEFIIEKNEFLY